MLIGIMQLISATPRSACGEEQLAEGPVLGDREEVDAREREEREPEDDHAAADRSLRASVPTIGAVTNMKAPVTNIVSPICERVVAAHPREEQRVEVGQPVEADAEHEGQQRADREVAVGEGAQVDDRRRARSAPAQKKPTPATTPTMPQQEDRRGPGTSRCRRPPRARIPGCRERSPASPSPSEVEPAQQREVRLVEVDQEPGTAMVTAMPGTTLTRNSQCQEKSSVR